MFPRSPHPPDILARDGGWVSAVPGASDHRVRYGLAAAREGSPNLHEGSPGLLLSRLRGKENQFGGFLLTLET